MGEIKKTKNFGLGLPEHFDPSVDKMSQNMELIDSALFKSIPSTVSSLNFNTALETGTYLIKGNALGTPNSSTSYNYSVVVFAVDNNHVYQIARSMGNSLMYYRYKNGASSFGSWYKIWNSANDGSGSGLDADLLDNLHSSSFYRKDYTSTDFNSATSEGKYRINSSNNAPYTGCTDWVCLVYHLSGGTSELYQIAMEECQNVPTSITGGSTTAYSVGFPMVFVRKRYNSTWYSWQMLWHSGNDGSGSGLNADKLDDKHASDFVSCIKSTSSTNIDSITTEGMYEYTNVTSTKGLPSFTGDGATYGLIVKSVKGNSSYNCCFQILLKDGCSYVYMRYYHGGTWSSWEKLNPTASELLTKIKTVDGSGSGLDADTLDGKDSSYFSPLNEINITNMSELDTITAPQYKTEVYRVYGFFKADDEFWSALPHSYNGFLFITSTNRLHDNLDDYHDYYVQTLVNYNGDVMTRVKSVDKLETFDNVAWGDWNTSTTTSNLNSQIQQIDGAGSGIDADKFEGLHGTDYVVCKKINQSSANTSALNNLIRTGLYVVDISSTDTAGSPTGSAGIFSVTVITSNTSYSTQTAIDVTTGKLYIRNRYSSNTWGSWSEVTPLIPVVSSDPTNPSNGQLWIRSDL